MNVWRLARELAQRDVASLGARLERRLRVRAAPYVERMRVEAQLRAAARAERRLRSFDPRRVPVIINSFNRVVALREQLAWLERAGLRDITILDNASRYPPLLELLRRTPYRVVHLGANVGPTALWDSEAGRAVFRAVRDGFYVYTDPDVIPVDECPLDVLQHFRDTLRGFPRKAKIGFGLKIDDLPAHYARAAEVVAWERPFWERAVAPGVYDAPVDTTFALYRPRTGGPQWLPALRTGPPYVARHAPWYADSGAPDEEERFYRGVVREHASHWMTGKIIERR